MRTKRLVPLVLLFLAAMLGTYACSSNSSEGFAIYLTKDNIPPARMDALSYVRLSFQHLITAEDLRAYDPTYHRMELGAEALNRISALEVPTTGKSFLVCVDKSHLLGCLLDARVIPILCRGHDHTAPAPVRGEDHPAEPGLSDGSLLPWGGSAK